LVSTRLAIGRTTEGTLGRRLSAVAKLRSKKCWRRDLITFNKLAVRTYYKLRARVEFWILDFGFWIVLFNRHQSYNKIKVQNPVCINASTLNFEP